MEIKFNRKGYGKRKRVSGFTMALICLSTLLLTTGLNGHLSAQEAEIQTEVNDVEEEIEIIKEEIRKLRLEIAMPEVYPEASYYGLGPAASKVYFAKRGLSIGGYGEVIYENYLDETKTDRADVLRFIPYFGYKFSDSILMNAELEFEHAGIKDIKERKPEVYVEFLYLDFMLKPWFNLRPGLFLVPASRMNEYHEPTVFYGVLRPDVERTIIPTVWREIGLMVYGDILPGLSYKTGVMNGLRTDTIKDWIGDGRQKGAEINYNKVAGIFRLDYSGRHLRINALRGLDIGGSVYVGESEDKKGADVKGNQRATFSLFVAEFQYDFAALHTKGLFSYGNATGNDAFKTYQDGEDTKSRSKTVMGWYAEAGYNILSHITKETLASLSPFIRYEKYDLNKKVFTGEPDPKKDRTVLTLGIDFKPHPQVVLKADYQIRDTSSDLEQGKGDGKDEWKIDQFNLGIGFIF